MFLLDGRKVKEVGLENLKSKLAKLDKTLTLAVIQIGNDPASNIYVSNKNKTATKLGCNFIHIKFDETVEEKEVLEKIDELNYDEDIDGILVQMPIPKHLNETLIQNRVKSYKDVDGLTDINAGLLVHNKDSLISCTPHGILTLLNYYDIKISKKHVVIVGRSNLVGKPLINLMLNNDATVTVCHSKTENLSDITKTADILIVAVGRPNFIKEDMVKDGAVVVDVGINRVDDKIVGDVDFDSVSKKVSAITPVPGGVGQMTILELFNNLYKAYHLRIQGK
ncbi:MAG: bifunctional 5,10-methylenetetrahydrofolate dehydrogenase/5,10-methenyltetrahydrofolate cyclohydrolase [Bacilli bacterium]